MTEPTEDPGGQAYILRMRPRVLHRHALPSLVLACAVIALAPLDAIYDQPRGAAIAAYLFQMAISMAGFYVGYAIAYGARIRIHQPPNWYTRLVVSLRGFLSYMHFAVRVFLICAFEAMSLVFLMHDPVAALKQMRPEQFVAVCLFFCAIHIAVSPNQLGRAAWECTAIPPR